MGLFSSKKVVTVASSAYNLAGDWDSRPNLYQTTAIYTLLTKQDSEGLGTSLVEAMVGGPRYTQRSFLRWATENFDIGRIRASLDGSIAVDAEAVADALESQYSTDITVTYALVDDPDIQYWAEQWILENRPDDYASSWIVDYNLDTGIMTIEFAPADIETISDTSFPTAYQANKDYLITYLSEKRPDQVTLETTNSWTYDDVVMPSTAGYSLTGSANHVTQDITLVTTTTTETSDDPGNPTVVVTSSDTTFEEKDETYRTETYVSTDSIAGWDNYDRTVLELEYRYEIQTQTTTTETTDGSTGVVTTITVEQEVVVPVYNHRTLEYAVKYDNTTGNESINIYMIGSGNSVLDAFARESSSLDEFFPVIPIRVKNKPITANKFDDIYEDVETAYEKSTDADLEELLDELDENPDIDDIDYVYLVHGIEANTTEKEGMRYVFEFFRTLMAGQKSTATDLADFLAAVDAGTLSDADLPPLTTLKMQTGSNSYDIDYDVRISWLHISEDIKSGSDHSIGELWWSPKANIDYGPQDINRIEHVVLNWQYAENAYHSLTIYGMVHLNYVYQSKRVETTLRDVIDETTDDSSFVIPYHLPTISKLPLSKQLQLTVSSRVLVLNSYEVTKIKWWQKGIFKILAVVVVAVVGSLVVPGLGGILGANLAVGTSLGLTGTAAIVAGAIANALAAMVLSYAINIGATAIFGEELGGVIAAVISIVAFNMASSLTSTGSLALNFNELLSIDNLMKVVDAVSQGVVKWAQNRVADINEDLVDLTQSYEEDMADIEEKTAELLGYSGVFFDPISLWTGLNDRLVKAESSSTFLQRTLLTGSDLADLSINMIGDMSDITLTLPDYTT